MQNSTGAPSRIAIWQINIVFSIHTDGKVSARLADYKYKTALFKTLENLLKIAKIHVDSFLLIVIMCILKSFPAQKF